MQIKNMSSSNTFSLLILLSLLFTLDSSDSTTSLCQLYCGGIKISYPFGIGEGCYRDKWYEIECVSTNHHTSPSRKFVPFLSSINKEVVSFSPHESMSYDLVRIKSPIASKGCSSDREEFGSLLNLTNTPFYVTQANSLIVVGCNNTAALTYGPAMPKIVKRCKSSCSSTRNHSTSKDYSALVSCNDNDGYDDHYCNENRTKGETSNCKGITCCQTKMPNSFQQIIDVRIDNTTTTTRGCKVAFLTDMPYFLSDGSDPQKLHAKGYSTVELGWFIHTANYSFIESLGCYDMKEYIFGTSLDRLCRNKEIFGLTYALRCACDYNDYLSYARCFCVQGFKGNPYEPGGCKDINECQQKYLDDGVTRECGETNCVKVKGGHYCQYESHSSSQSTPYEYSFPPKWPRQLGIGLGASFGSLLFVGGVYFLYKFLKKQRKLNQKKKYFKRNGGLLLQQQLISSEGKVEKTKVFSSKELEKATENFSSNRILGQGGQGTVYKGMLVDGSIVAVKKSKVVEEDKLQEFINEVVILSQINHRNIVKLLGCCLETNIPVLVYEFIPNGNLFEHLHDDLDDNTMVTWEVRRIAVDIAGALSYLHSSASSPIYHRDVKSTNIMLDEKYRAKVSDFGTSRSVTVDHTHLTTVVSGTVGYVDPEYFQSSQFTDKSDVYSFGVVLVELITGEKSISFLRSQENRTLATYFILAMKENKLLDIIDSRIRDGCMLSQVTAMAKVARKCLSLKGRKRPSMREVSVELDNIRLSSRDIQPDEDVSENEEEEVVEDIIREESENNVVVSAPASQYNNVAGLSSSWSDVEPLFPSQTR